MSKNNGEAVKTDELKFRELVGKIHAGIEMKPDTNYLMLIKKGSLSSQDREVLISLWRRNFPNTGMLLFEVDDPTGDVKLLEMVKKEAR